VATFTNLADDLAETITLNFTGGSLMTSVASNAIAVPAAAATHLGDWKRGRSNGTGNGDAANY